MIKGHVQIDLHNHNSGFKERIEQDNMVTNALNYVIPACVSGDLYAHDMIMPLANNALGGILLFDGKLTEDAANIHFPMNCHLIGHAGQSTNSDNPMQGSYNVSESKRTDTGHIMVWDFNTSQANGTIQSLGRTHKQGGENPFRQINGSRPWYLPTNDTSEKYPLAHDKANQILYYLRNYNSSDEHGIDVYKSHIPCHLIGVGDAVNTVYGTEQTANIQYRYGWDSTHVWWSDYATRYRSGYDGYCYRVYVPRGNNTGDGTFYVHKMKSSDFSFTEADVQTVTATNCLLQGTSYDVVSNGYAYLISYDSHSIYKMELANPVNVVQISIGDDAHVYPESMVALPNGGISFEIYHRLSDGTYKYNLAFIYPDSVLLQSGYTYATTEGSSKPLTRAASFETDDLIGWGGDDLNTDRYGGYLITNYLATICNLTSAVTKTAASSMKVTYTLTNVDG